MVAGTAQKLLVTYSISPSATVGATIGAQITNTASVTISATDIKTLSTTPLASNMQTIASSADALTVTHTIPASVNAPQSTTNQVLDRLNLAAGAGDGITVNTIRVSEIGTATDSDISAVRLINDANSNGVYDAGETF